MDNSCKAKRTINRTTIEVKKEIISKHESGARVRDLARQFGIAKSTICTILKNKKAIKGANVARGVKTLTKQRTQTIEEVEKLLFIWITEKQLAGDSISESMICEKALRLHADLVRNIPGASEGEIFKASRGWFDNFKRRSGIHIAARHGEVAIANREDADQFVLEFQDYVAAEGFLPQQVFNCDETGLFWKKMPKRTYITEEEKSLPGHKPMKDRLTLLLCANASGDFKLKPLLVYLSENPRVFKKNNVIKSELPVMWRANSRAWLTRRFFVEWVHEVFGPSVKKYLQDQNLPLKCLLVMDNAPAHPPGLADELREEFGFISVKFLPPNTTPLIQPMDQQVMSNFKKLYTKAVFQMCSEVTSDPELTLREFWKNRFNILHCLHLIDKAWGDVSQRTLKLAWKELWPAAVPEGVFEDVEEDAAVVEDIVSLGKSLGLEVSREDVEELVEDHKTELTTEELQNILMEQQQAATEELSEEEEEEKRRENVPTALIEEMCAKWAELQSFVEKYHPDAAAVSHATNTFNDSAMSHFRQILKQRKRSAESEPGVSGVRRESARGILEEGYRTLEQQSPFVIIEGDYHQLCRPHQAWYVRPLSCPGTTMKEALAAGSEDFKTEVFEEGLPHHSPPHLEPQEIKVEPEERPLHSWDTQWQGCPPGDEPSHSTWDAARPSGDETPPVIPDVRREPAGKGRAKRVPAFRDGDWKISRTLKPGDPNGKGDVPSGGNIDTEAKRQRFRGFRYWEAEGPRTACDRLQELCYGWLKPKRHTKEQILELVVLEQFLAVLPPEIQSWVRDGRPETCDQAVDLAEAFLLRPQEDLDTYDEVVVGLSDGDQALMETEVKEEVDDSPSSPGREILLDESGKEARHVSAEESESDMEEEECEMEEGSFGDLGGAEGHMANEIQVWKITGPQSLQEGMGRHVCPVCERAFTRKSSLNRHLIIHSGEKPYRCLDCGKGFNRRTNLMAHEAVHTEEKSYQCSECGESFKPKWGIAPYQVDPTGEKVYKCLSCKKNLRQTGSVMSWRLLNEQGKEIQPQPSDAPGPEKEENVPEHQNEPEIDLGKDVSVGTIESVIVPGGDLCFIKTPAKLYKGKRMSPCPVCGKVFATQSSVNRHQRIHTGEKPYKCSYCGKSFNQKTSLLTHEVIHTEEKPYQCSDCGKSFRHSSGLQVHQRMHTGEKPYTCLVCRKSFSQRAHVIKHIVRKHKGEKPSSYVSQPSES
ncbi:uncharacterized protein LOC114592144 isoform X1 [Podarcis muralis]